MIGKHINEQKRREVTMEKSLNQLKRQSINQSTSQVANQTTNLPTKQHINTTKTTNGMMP